MQAQAAGAQEVSASVAVGAAHERTLSPPVMGGVGGVGGLAVPKEAVVHEGVHHY